MRSRKVISTRPSVVIAVPTDSHTMRGCVEEGLVLPLVDRWGV